MYCLSVCQQDRQCAYNVTSRRVHITIVSVEKQYLLHICVCAHACVCVPGNVCVSFCMCVHVALLIQYATSMRHIVTSSVAPLAPSYFATLSHKWHYFRKKKFIEPEMCVLIFSTTFIQNISHSKKNLARYRHKCRNVFM